MGTIANDLVGVGCALEMELLSAQLNVKSRPSQRGALYLVLYLVRALVTQLEELPNQVMLW